MGIYMIVLHWLDYRRRKIQYIYGGKEEHRFEVANDGMES